MQQVELARAMLLNSTSPLVTDSASLSQGVVRGRNANSLSCEAAGCLCCICVRVLGRVGGHEWWVGAHARLCGYSHSSKSARMQWRGIFQLRFLIKCAAQWTVNGLS